MRKEVTIGSQTLSLASNGATPIRYKLVFGSDLMVEMNQINKGTRDEGETLDMISRLAFIMYMQATADKSIWPSINKESYMEFLEDFEAMDFANASGEIMNIYLGQSAGTSTPKKEEGLQTEK